MSTTAPWVHRYNPSLATANRDPVPYLPSPIIPTQNQVSANRSQPGQPGLSPENRFVGNPSPPSGRPNYTKLATASALFGLGLATHHLPGKTVSQQGFKFLLPPDWKSWARVGLGVATVSQLNQAFSWKPPAWLTGVESAAIITPLSLRFNQTSGLTLLLIAPLVAAVVQSSEWAQKAFVGDLKQYCQIPESISGLGISLSVGALGVLASLGLHKQLRNFPVKKLPLKQFPGLQAKAYQLKANLKEILGSSMLLQNCPRGCSPSLICLSEIGEMVGGLWQDAQQKHKQPNQTRNVLSH